MPCVLKSTGFFCCLGGEERGEEREDAKREEGPKGKEEESRGIKKGTTYESCLLQKNIAIEHLFRVAVIIG
jgi:hypothetical protein